MATQTPAGDINTRLTHRGVLFSITRCTQGDESPAYRWAVGPVAEGQPCGTVEGPRAFARAHHAALAAIDAMLGAPG